MNIENTTNNNKTISIKTFFLFSTILLLLVIILAIFLFYFFSSISNQQTTTEKQKTKHACFNEDFLNSLNKPSTNLNNECQKIFNKFSNHDNCTQFNEYTDLCYYGFAIIYNEMFICEKINNPKIADDCFNNPSTQPIGEEVLLINNNLNIKEEITNE